MENDSKKIDGIEKKISFEVLQDMLSGIDETKDSDIKKISDIFGRTQDDKKISNEQVEELFNVAIAKTKKDSWRFLIEVYSRFYNRPKVKTAPKIIALIKEEVEQRINNYPELKELVCKLAGDPIGKSIDYEIRDVIGKYTSDTIMEPEIVSYVYLSVLIHLRNKYPQENIVQIIKAERILFQSMAKVENNDPLFVKNIKRSLFENKHQEKFAEITHLYNGLCERNDELEQRNIKLQQILNELANERSELETTVMRLNEALQENKDKIEEVNRELETQKNINDKQNDRNEFEKNKYQQQAYAAKRTLVEQLTTALRFELEGIEDVADKLSDEKCRTKIHRRIDRIWQIIQKIGE